MFNLLLLLLMVCPALLLRLRCCATACPMRLLQFSYAGTAQQL
jgi:hypothetical protein